MATQAPDQVRIGERPTHVRYGVIVFAVALAVVTYIDRVCISQAAPAVVRDLKLSPVQMSYAFTAFIWAYALFEVPGGFLGDWMGPRRVLMRIVLWWSVFTAATGWAWNLASLTVTRALFGAGEAGCFPNLTKAFTTWLPHEERVRAQGIMWLSARWGGAFTPYLVYLVLQLVSWRRAFEIFGAVGIVWAVLFYRWYRDNPKDNRHMNAAELALLRGSDELAHGHSNVPWGKILRSPTVWLLCAQYFCLSYGWYFYITWLPTYLERARGFTSVKLGVLAGLPLMLSVLADLCGGLATDYASRRFGLRWGRAGIGVVSCLGAGLAMLAGAGVQDGVSAAILIAIAAASSNLMLGASWGSCIDIGGNQTGLIGGVMNTAGQVGGILSPIILALILRHFSSWSAPLYLTGLLYSLGAVAWCMVDASKTIWPEKKGLEVS